MGKKILLIESSILGEGSKSRELAHEFVQKIGGVLTVRSLGEDPLPPLDGEIFSGFQVDSGGTPRQQETRALSDICIKELEEADILVIAAPMYNFSIPVQLKGWFDFVLRAGKTFRYTESGPLGLVENRRAVIISTRGGVHGDTDFAVPLAKTALSFIGITDISVVIAEGLAYGPDIAKKALSDAGEELAQLAKSIVLPQR